MIGGRRHVYGEGEGERQENDIFREVANNNSYTASGIVVFFIFVVECRGELLHKEYLKWRV